MMRGFSIIPNVIKAKFNKPSVFITSNEINDSYMRPDIDAFNKIINSHVINISKETSKPLSIEKLFKRNKMCYWKYFRISEKF